MKYALKEDYLDFVTKFVEYPLTNLFIMRIIVL